MSFQLSAEIIQLWVVDLLASNEQVESACKLLSGDEKQRADRFRFPEHRRRFVMARAALRKILAACMAIDAKEVVFEYSEFGKPRLAWPRDLRFNTSHSNEKALIACTRGREIGVDIEWEGRELEVDDIAERFFSAGETQKLRAIPDDRRHRGFLRCWTCKEAYLKAVGKGLSLDLKSFDVSPALSDPAEWSPGLEKYSVSGWSLLVPGVIVDGYVAALVTEPGECWVQVLLDLPENTQR